METKLLFAFLNIYCLLSRHTKKLPFDESSNMHINIPTKGNQTADTYSEQLNLFVIFKKLIYVFRSCIRSSVASPFIMKRNGTCINIWESDHHEISKICYQVEDNVIFEQTVACIGVNFKFWKKWTILKTDIITLNSKSFYTH